MSSMPLVQVHGVNDVRIDQVAIPQAGPNDAIIKVAACGICGSDLGYITMGGLTPPGVPMPLGHELSGTVASLGHNVQHLTVGQRVTVNPMANQHAIGNGGMQGAFAPWLLVKDAATCTQAILPIPDAMDFTTGALIEPLSVAMHGVNQSQIRAGQSVVVLGAGPIGLCTVVVMKYLGIDDILVADQSDHRLSIAKQLGARAVCNVLQEDLASCLRREHGTADLMGMSMPGTDVYIEATGVGAVLEQAISLSKHAATVVVLGLHKKPIQLDPVNLLVKELKLTGSMAYPSEFPDVIAMLQSGKIDTSPLVSHQFELQDFLSALELARDPGRATKVMITMA